MIPDINLLPKLEKKASGSKLLYIVMGAVTVLALGLFGTFYVSSHFKLEDLQAQQQTLTSEQNELQAQLDTIQSLNAGSLEESLAFVERVSYPVTPLIDESQKLLTDHTYLRSYAFSAEAVSIAADFEMLSDVAGYVEALNGSEYFSDVQVTNVSNFELNPTAVEKSDSEKFQELPRFSVSIELFIDSMYLATGGGQP
jgi:hypothetical protein